MRGALLNRKGTLTSGVHISMILDQMLHHFEVATGGGIDKCLVY